MGLNAEVPPHVDPSYFFETQAPTMFAVGALMMFISATSVALRFWSRYLAGMSFWLDDWFALVAVLFNFAVIIINFHGTSLGWGRHTIVAATTDPNYISEWFRDLFIITFFYNVGIATFKCSFLALYVRIFGIRGHLRKACIVLGIVTLIWLVVAEFVTLFRCNPISGQWKPAGAKCILTLHNWNIFMSSPTIVLAIITLAIPIPLVWQLKLRPAQRFGVIGVFMVGALDLIISIFRMYYATHANAKDLMWGNANMYYWSVAEATAGIMSCCISTYAPLFHPFQRQNTPTRTKTKSSNVTSDVHAGKYVRSDSTDSLTVKNDGYFEKSLDTTGKTSSSHHDEVELSAV